ncbi:ROK family transcriptional regulator [Sporosarcina sp. 179-K 3D1 HS]|uniref:ROK family transcriptional regulator n=1 Tax=Sporosarcina sp. 179-K 3D1 HS TaxID=3232169 RepID=UPI0039A2B8AF
MKKFLMDDSRKNELPKMVYKLIHHFGPITKIDLGQHIQLKPTTMTRLIDELLQMGCIREAGTGPSSGGRPPILYEVNEAAAWIIGIDLSRNASRLVLTDMKFNVVDQYALLMTNCHTPDVVFEEIKGVIRNWLKMYSISTDELLGIGVGTVGPILRTEGKVMNSENFLAPGWDLVNISAELSEFSTELSVDNGANSAAIAEYYFYDELYTNIIYCINGYGIRGGVLHNGKVTSSRQGDTSAMGHLIVQANGKVCICGKSGCLSAYATLPAMIKDFKAVSGKSCDSEQFLEEINAGNEQAIFIAKQGAFHMGIGLANMINTLRTELVVLHGPLVYGTSFFFEEVVQSAKSHIYTKETPSPLFKKGSLRERAIALGGAIQLFHSFFELNQ